MSPTFVEDIFSSGMRNGELPRSSDARSAGNDVWERSPQSDGIISPRKERLFTTTRRSPKKADRIMAEKGVDTTELRVGGNGRKDTTTPAKTPQRASNSQPSTVKVSRVSMASSQVSYWEGDEEFEDLAMQCDEQEVPDTQTTSNQPSTTSGSGSSGSSFSSAITVSTAITSVCSDSLPESPRRRKRIDSFDGECRRPPLPAINTHLHTAAPKSDLFLQGPMAESPTSLTVTASYARESKKSRPIQRNPRNPGHSSAVIGTSAVTTNGIVQSKPLDISIPAAKSPVKTSPPDSEPFIIAHDNQAQALLDKHCIHKGIQFEIARGVTQQWWTWSDITEEKVLQLKGSNAEKAGKVGDVVGTAWPRQTLSPAVLTSRQAIYNELDREHQALMEGRERGLGLMGPWHGEDNWYGGRIQLNARMSINKNSKEQRQPFSVSLDSFGYGKSNRATRYATSLSILQLKIEKDIKWKFKDEMIDFLARRFVLCGRVFCPFHPKEDKVYLVEINEDFERRAVRELGDYFRQSFDLFIRWHNSLEGNSEQPISKWATRWALSLSTSRPVLKFEPQNIYLNIPDIYAEGEEQRTETMMTDGCGFINQSALVQIAKAVNANCPTAVQGRIAGAKGLWLLHPDPKHRSLDEPPKIWIRDSQIKVNHPPTSEWGRSHLIFDLVRIQRLTVPSSLYMQTIQNMSYNGVKDKVFEKLLEVGLKKEIGALATWDGPNARTHLAKAVENVGGIMGSRLSRLAGNEARLFGYVRDEREGADGDGEEVDTTSGLVERDVSSGCPTKLYESTREMLQAGFTPLRNSLLRTNLRQIIKNVIEVCLEQFHITVDVSAEAFIVPDPYGVLEEGEIFFRSTKCIGDPTTSVDPHTFLGPVLVTRNPTGVASDVRKVTAVSHDKLLSYTDVIVFSIKGKRSLASYLGGGDTVTVIAEPLIVNGFTNSRVVDAPEDLRDRFEREIEKVSSFLSRVKDMPVLAKERELYKKLLLGLSDSKVGLYSMFHDNAVYYLGYDSPEAVRLAYMFTTCLDASKTGLRVKADVFREDAKEWNIPRPQSMQKSDEQQRLLMSGYNSTRRSRPKGLGPFVLDSLKHSGEALHKAALVDYEKLCEQAEHWNWKDPDLVKYWSDTKLWSTRMKDVAGFSGLLDDIRKMETFVEKLCDEYIVGVGDHHGKSRSPKKTSRTFSSDSAVSTTSNITRSRSLAAVKHEFTAKFDEGTLHVVSFVPPEMAKQVMASYAYYYASSKASRKLATEFPFTVAHETLCALKAKKEGVVSATREFADYTVLHSNLLKSSARFDDL
ncbi:hypothetical protein M0805_003273 [Coniferiporia weirii]|nr:hypothetical protein M0805_003273 [Coniferiporia weirii]